MAQAPNRERRAVLRIAIVLKKLDFLLICFLSLRVDHFAVKSIKFHIYETS